jgi:hypothetical protein
LEIKQNNFVAHGQRTSDGFVVLKGSQIKAEMSPLLRDKIRVLRGQYAGSIDDNWHTTADILLMSANEAAHFVLGYPTNAVTTWKTADGKTLKEIQTSEADELK